MVEKWQGPLVKQMSQTFSGFALVLHVYLCFSTITLDYNRNFSLQPFDENSTKEYYNILVHDYEFK